MNRIMPRPGDETRDLHTDLILSMLRDAAQQERWHSDHVDRLSNAALGAGIPSEDVARAVFEVGT